MVFYDAWNYLNEHKIFQDKLENGLQISQFKRCLDIEVVKINPEKGRIDDNEKLNTATEVWLECGPYEKSCPSHDVDLDCGAPTFEEAIIKLAKLVKKKYG